LFRFIVIVYTTPSLTFVSSTSTRILIASYLLTHHAKKNKAHLVIEDSIARTKPKRTLILKKIEDERLRLKTEAEKHLYRAAFDGDVANVVSYLDEYGAVFKICLVVPHFMVQI
jgi:hypothetical protein